MIRNIALFASACSSRQPPLRAQDDTDPPEVVGGSGPLRLRPSPSPPCPRRSGASEALGRQIAEVIASDLRSTGAFTPLGPNGIGGYTVAQAGAPAYGEWRNAGAGALVAGYVEARADGRITVACLLHDVTAGRQLASQGFAVAAADWRRAAHKCADTVYARLTGEGAYLDTRIVYVAETGPKTNRVKRIALMDSDGTNLRYLTTGRANVTTPRFSPQGDQAGLHRRARPQAARVRGRHRDRRRAPARPRRRDHLRAALLARRPPHRLLDGRRAATPTSLSSAPMAARRAG